MGIACEPLRLRLGAAAGSMRRDFFARIEHGLHRTHGGSSCCSWVWLELLGRVGRVEIRREGLASLVECATARARGPSVGAALLAMDGGSDRAKRPPMAWCEVSPWPGISRDEIRREVGEVWPRLGWPLGVGGPDCWGGSVPEEGRGEGRNRRSGGVACTSIRRVSLTP